MAKDQIAKALGTLRRLENERKALLARLLVADPLIRGSLSHLRQRCGNPGCHCADSPAHPVTRLATSDAGRQRCQLVRQADVPSVTEHVARYREFREGLRSLDAMFREQKRRLRGLMEQRDVGYH
jgi:hypothetical protein